MCGRYTITNPYQIPMRFDVPEEQAADLLARFNVAPTQQVPVVVARQDGRALELMRWGFQPRWITDPKAPAPFNARAETLLEKPLFRGALAHGRCLIPADGFYEWQALPGSRAKQPMYARLRDDALFAFAGLYAVGQDAEGLPRATCTIITTTPNAVMAPIHARMPVILLPEVEAAWLDPEIGEPQFVLPYLRPYAAERMTVYPVSTLVSSARNDGPELMQPLAPA